MKYHPDKQTKKAKHERNEAQARFELITEAYEVLSDSSRKKKFEKKYYSKLDFLKRIKKMDEKTRKMAKELNEKERKFQESKLSAQRFKKRQKASILKVQEEDLKYIRAIYEELKQKI